MTGIFVSGGVMLGLGLILAGLLALANKKLHVREDPRIDVVESMLPGSNCGACGFAGCRALAEAVVSGNAAPGKCTANTPEAVERIAQFLGVDAGMQEKRVARLACAGGSSVARQQAAYWGLESCKAAALVSGGGKACAWGCLGLGDCERVCPFDAIHMNAEGLPVVDENKCTACGKCVAECPRNLFSLQPISHRLWVACQNKMRGKAAREVCAVSCGGCGLCAKDAPELLCMRDNLPVVDYSKPELATQDAIQRCPTGAIVWFGENGEVIRGEKARGKNKPADPA